MKRDLNVAMRKPKANVIVIDQTERRGITYNEEWRGKTCYIVLTDETKTAEPAEVKTEEEAVPCL